MGFNDALPITQRKSPVGKIRLTLSTIEGYFRLWVQGVVVVRLKIDVWAIMLRDRWEMIWIYNQSSICANIINLILTLNQFIEDAVEFLSSNMRETLLKVVFNDSYDLDD